MDVPTEVILSSMDSSKTFQGILYSSIAITTVTPAANINATWLPPDNASAPKPRITSIRVAARIIKGSSETNQWGVLFIIYGFTYHRINRRNSCHIYNIFYSTFKIDEMYRLVKTHLDRTDDLYI